MLLPGLVFEAAYRLRVVELRRWAGGLALLAVPGVLISAAIVAIVLHVATGLRLDLAFIVGAMVSATDPAAVVATFKQLRAPASLSTMVDGESLLNDGTGLVLFAHRGRARSTRRSGRARRSSTFAGTVLLSIAIGLAAGFVASRVIGHRRRPPRRADDLGRARLRQLHRWPISFHLSGVIATVTAAVVLGNIGPGMTMSETGEDAIDTVWEFLAYLLTAVVFLLVGLAIPPTTLLDAVGPIAWADRRRSSSVARSWSTSCSVEHRGWRTVRRPCGPGPDRLAPRPVLVRSARSGGRRDGALAAGRHPATCPAPGDHLRGRPVHAAVQGTTVGWVVDRAIRRRGKGSGAVEVGAEPTESAESPA